MFLRIKNIFGRLSFLKLFFQKLKKRKDFPLFFLEPEQTFEKKFTFFSSVLH
uniref:Uncharacterized protein n=1 Tax=Chlorella vulgaris TaxID=3077 RepID=V9H0S8_CHLVU|nr:hypothetical protein ChvulCp140 [Chlorella vulgaris]pir/T07326/ hypothetical protein 51b - Chlorella vulgaris chloroplast [Chlorella vulgaris]BAA57974.1 unnamed protein product [Chlorella vulgaris]